MTTDIEALAQNILQSASEQTLCNSYAKQLAQAVLDLSAEKQKSQKELPSLVVKIRRACRNEFINELRQIKVENIRLKREVNEESLACHKASLDPHAGITLAAWRPPYPEVEEA